jgi:hypothetical protein
MIIPAIDTFIQKANAMILQGEPEVRVYEEKRVPRHHKFKTEWIEPKCPRLTRLIYGKALNLQTRLNTAQPETGP